VLNFDLTGGRKKGSNEEKNRPSLDGLLKFAVAKQFGMEHPVLSRARGIYAVRPGRGQLMPIHLVALTPSLSSIGKFLGTQLKDPAKRALRIDPLSKALHKGIQSFLVAFEAEYERREIFTTLLEGSTKESVSAFVREPSVLEALASAFTHNGFLEVSTLAGLWSEIRLPGGGRLVDLPAAFDWDVVRTQYLDSVGTIKSETPELSDAWAAENIDRTREAVEGLRGVVPRFTIEKYRNALLQEYGTLKLSAIHAEYDQASSDRTVALQKIYIQQRVKEASPPRYLSRDYRRRLQAEGRLFGVPEETEHGNIALEYERAPARPLRETLADESFRCVVILGDPGLGKSTLLQHLALEWAEGGSQSVPFLIELRKYTRDHSHPRSFLEFMEKGTWSYCHLAQAELDRYLRDNRGTILFDGLDEVFDESLRGNIVAEIVGFARDYPRARVMVTTRVVGYAIGSPNPELFRAAGFRALTLQDFNDLEINEFILKWYAASVSDTTERDELARRLTKDIACSKSIRELAGNPLLLTMMALLNRRKHLPRERLKLYEACAELLVEGWDAARHLERSAYLTHDDKIEILQRIAYEIQHERQGLSGNMISEKRLRDILIDALSDRKIDNPRIAAEKIVTALSERDFMLCSVGDEQFSFVHRTFLEYFCAKEYLSHLENGGSANELLDLFRRQWHDDTWHEVLRLVCAMVGPDLARNLAQELLSAGAEMLNWQAIFLGAECLTEVRQVGKVEAERAVAIKTLRRLLHFRGDDPEDDILVRTGAVERLAKFSAAEEDVKAALFEAAGNEFWKVRFGAVEELARLWPAETTRQWMLDQAVGPDWKVRMAAVHGLAEGWPDEVTRRFLVDQLNSDDRQFSFHTAIEELGRRWPETLTREWLTDLAVRHHDQDARRAALRELARRWPDGETKAWLVGRTRSENLHDAEAAAGALLDTWADEPTRETLLIFAEQREKPIRRDAAIIALAWRWRNPKVRHLILERLQELDHATARSRLVGPLAYNWLNDDTKQKLMQLATDDGHVSVRLTAISHLAQIWKNEETRLLVQRISGTDDSERVRSGALSSLALGWPTEDTKQFLVQRFMNDKANEVRSAALTEILDRWPDDREASRLRDEWQSQNSGVSSPDEV
jgi:energy-coupling factor transporter ATP-binding protein EcfA2